MSNNTTFERIGPFDLTSWDIIFGYAHCNFISSRPFNRVFNQIVLVILLMFAVMSALESKWVGFAVYGFILVIWLGVIPVAWLGRSQKRLHIACDAFGITAENDTIKSSFKWNTVKSVEVKGSRVFVALTTGNSLILPNRVFSETELANYVACIQHYLGKEKVGT
jgi:hypothetical protein